jgi:heme/copper-type cytochrome/quinol oxidase subunit 1
VLYWAIGRLSHQRFPTWAGQLHFGMMFCGVVLSFFPFAFTLKTLTSQPNSFRALNMITEIGAWLTVASLAFFICFTAYFFVMKRVKG